MKISASNILTQGRLLAVAIIVAGVALSAWNASANEAYLGFGLPHYKLRFFFNEALNYTWLGGLLLALAEIAARFGDEEPSGRVDWKLTTLVRVLGATVILGGISLTVWDARSVPGGPILFLRNSVAPGSKRAITRSAIEYAWQGGLLILAAEIADRLSWRSRDDEATPPDGGLVVEPAPSL